jgi:hypothetical protein
MKSENIDYFIYEYDELFLSHGELPTWKKMDSLFVKEKGEDEIYKRVHGKSPVFLRRMASLTYDTQYTYGKRGHLMPVVVKMQDGYCYEADSYCGDSISFFMRLPQKNDLSNPVDNEQT